jgi:branched-chain amino acid transport system ATP-binding protein
VSAAVSTRSLTKAFGSLVAVNEVDAEIEPGRVTAVIGPNGAGKSTLINLLSGQLLPTAGEVRVGDQAIGGMHPREIAALGIARTFQTPRLFPGFTALDNVLLGHYRGRRNRWLGAAARTPGSRREEDEARDVGLGWLAFAGLEEIADEEATALPIGTQRLVEFVRALATEPTVLLLDEPAAGLDATETAELGSRLREVAEAGVGVLLVEHDMGMVMSVAGTVVVLDQGRRIAVGPPAEVSRDPLVRAAYLGTDE